MPNITVEILKGRSLEQITCFAEALTRACSDHLDAGPDRVRVRFVELDEHHVYADGHWVEPYESPLPSNDVKEVSAASTRVSKHSDLG